MALPEFDLKLRQVFGRNNSGREHKVIPEDPTSLCFRMRDIFINLLGGSSSERNGGVIYRVTPITEVVPKSLRVASLGDCPPTRSVAFAIGLDSGLMHFVLRTEGVEPYGEMRLCFPGKRFPDMSDGSWARRANPLDIRLGYRDLHQATILLSQTIDERL